MVRARGTCRLDFRARARSAARIARPQLRRADQYLRSSGTPTNFGGDDKRRRACSMVYRRDEQVKFLALVANTGVHFRPAPRASTIPTGGNGLGIGNEWRWAVGCVHPARRTAKYRVGGTIFGQTGIEKRQRHRRHVLHEAEHRRSSVNIEGTHALRSADHWWVGAGAGSPRSLNALWRAGSFAIARSSVPTCRSSTPRRSRPSARPRAPRARLSLKSALGDRDNDGIPDDIDACPVRGPEGSARAMIRTTVARCRPIAMATALRISTTSAPNKPERQGQHRRRRRLPPRTTPTPTACPDAVDDLSEEPRARKTRIEKERLPELHQGREQRGARDPPAGALSRPPRRTILPESFPVLQEDRPNLLKANPHGIKTHEHRRPHGQHAAPAGAQQESLSCRAARNSVMNWLVQHGVEPVRLEAHGYGVSETSDRGQLDGRRTREEPPRRVQDRRGKRTRTRSRRRDRL